MHPIAALMLSRAIEEERRRVPGTRRRWLGDDEVADREGRPSRPIVRARRGLWKA